MNREIKFRVWWAKYNVWATEQSFTRCLIDQYGQLVKWDPRFIPEVQDQNDFIISQYTGLKDKNGKEIWEGDKVCIDDVPYQNLSIIGIVTYVEDVSGFRVVDQSGERYPLWIGEGIFEVIGNIYENSELLGGINEGN